MKMLELAVELMRVRTSSAGAYLLSVAVLHVRSWLPHWREAPPHQHSPHQHRLLCPLAALHPIALSAL